MDTFDTIESLINHCKNKSIILGVDGTVHPSRVHVNAQSLENGVQVFELMVAFATDANSWTHGMHLRGIDWIQSGLMVSNELLRQINNELSNPDSDIRRLSSWPIEQSFVYFDISDYTTMPHSHQLMAITYLNELLDDTVRRGRYSQLRSLVETKLSIGDGFIFVVGEAMIAAEFAAHLANLIENAVAHEDKVH